MPFTQRLIVPLFRSLCERGGRKGEKVGSRDKKCVFLLRVAPVWSVYILWKDIFICYEKAFIGADIVVFNMERFFMPAGK